MAFVQRRILQRYNLSQTLCDVYTEYIYQKSIIINGKEGARIKEVIVNIIRHIDITSVIAETEKSRIISSRDQTGDKASIIIRNF